MTSLKSQRIAILIDAENLEIEARNNYGSKIDYEKLLQENDSREVIRAMYFKPYDKVTPGWERKLKSWGYEVKTTPKNADCWLTVSAITLAEKCDVVVLVGGDKDYIPLIWFLQSKGVKTEIWSWDSCTSVELKSLADEFVPITPDFLVDKPSNLVTLNPNRRRTHA